MPQEALSPPVVEKIWALAAALREPMVEFARYLIRTPSLPGSEGNSAAIVYAEMNKLGYDRVWVDEAGNVIGQIRANTAADGSRGKSIMLNAHIDHVDVGDHDKWPYPPYSATLEDGILYGRGAADLKGSVACQVYAGGLLKRLGVPLANDVYVASVVQEEVGGLGSSTLAKHLKTDYAIIGEPSGNVLALGHRGRTEMLITITGKSVHASVPSSGINPLYSMARFLRGIEEMQFEIDPRFPFLGPTTVAATLISVDQTSPNVVPAECRLILDIRNTPMDTPEILLARMQELLQASLEYGASGDARINAITLKSYTGLEGTFSNAAPPFGIAPENLLVTDAQAVLSLALRRTMTTKVWPFCTDAGHLVAAGIEVIGFGPGREEVIHTVDEQITIEELVDALVANAALCLGL